MPDLESRNHFYLGRDHDLAAGETSDRPLLYKSKDLTTHAVCVGMTGSGKTGLCLSLLEEAALDGVPAICIDPKGDLGNLLLGFPELQPSDFRPWIDESVAERKGLTPDEFAQQTAELWKNGLASWGEGPERIQRYNDSVERLIFTPGASHGLPMTVLKSFDAPPKALREDNDAFLQRVSSAVSALLALLDIDADPVRSREHIFLSNVLKHEWNAGKDLSIADLIRNIQHPPFKTVGVLDLETFYREKDRTKLAMDLNNLLASPSFAGWMTGQPLNVQELYHSPPDSEGRVKPRLSIISIAHLSDSERMFFVTILLNEIVAWMRTQPGTGSLRSLLYMDEVFGYFPPSKNPPSKEPMLTLLKQARAFGLGCVLATQNPVDLDYKGLSNAGTWFLGRLQTERDKMRVMEGLEGASAQAGSAFDKQQMERTLAGVGSRVFLMNNVHEDSHRVFHTRWAMSYLSGPLSRDQIQKLMDPLREKFAPPETEPEKEPESKTEEPRQEEEQAPKEEPASTAAVERDPALLQKCQAAHLELKQRESELFWSILQILGFIPDIAYRIGDLVFAALNKKATTRRTSSMFAALGRVSDRFKKPGKAWGMWKKAFAEHQERKANLTGNMVVAPPLLPLKGWLAIVANFLISLLIVAMLWAVLAFFGGAISQQLGVETQTVAPISEEGAEPANSPAEQQEADQSEQGAS